MSKSETDLAAEDGRLLEDLEQGFGSVRDCAGPDLACSDGCSGCCVGPFPITRLDVWRLQRGMRKLERDQPRIAAAIVSRARASVERLREDFPGDFASGRLTPDPLVLDRFFAAHDDLACPALDTKSGSCRLYDARPVACRTYGPPLAFEGQSAPQCDLCFRGASDERIEACRWSPDPDGRERHLLDRIGASADEDWAMLIAHAIVQGSAAGPPR